MINRLSNMVCLLLLVTAFVVAGCQRGYKPDVLVYEPLMDPNFVMPDYVSRAIEATGGCQAWTKAKKLQGDCVVTFYKPDGSFYLTEAHLEIYPWIDSIRISAREPQGRVVCQLSGGSLSVLEEVKSRRTENTLPIGVMDRYFAKAILDITTAPVRFLDESVVFTKRSEPIKMEGLWYYPIERATIASSKQGAVEPYWSKVVFYQNRDTSLVDTLWFAREEFLAVRGYDYREVKDKGVLVPTKIEIFRTDVEGVLLQRMVKIDFYTLKSSE